jgi:hypothetical protein
MTGTSDLGASTGGWRPGTARMQGCAGPGLVASTPALPRFTPAFVSTANGRVHADPSTCSLDHTDLTRDGLERRICIENHRMPVESACMVETRGTAERTCRMEALTVLSPAP